MEKVTGYINLIQLILIYGIVLVQLLKIGIRVFRITTSFSSYDGLVKDHVIDKKEYEDTLNKISIKCFRYGTIQFLLMVISVIMVAFIFEIIFGVINLFDFLVTNPENILPTIIGVIVVGIGIFALYSFLKVNYNSIRFKVDKFLYNLNLRLKNKGRILWEYFTLV